MTTSQSQNDPMQIFSSRTTVYPIWTGMTILLMFGYLYLISKSHRRSLPVCILAFSSGILLAFSYINDVYNTNGIISFRGRLFDEFFISITSNAFITLLLSLLCLSVSIGVTAKYFTGKPLPEIRKRSVVTKSGRKAGYFAALFSDIKRDKLLYIMLALPITYYLLFYYLPFSGLRMAFYDYSILRGYGDFVGLDRFRDFFTDDLFWRVLRNTLVLNIYTLLWSFPVPILLAILFNELRNKKFRTGTQTISYIPRFISTMIIAGMVVNFLSPSSGLINIIRGWFGADPIFFIMFPEYFRTIFVMQHVWVTAGFGSIIYYSSLQSIDAELYEAATIDGAGRFKQVLHITLPGLYRTIAIMLILAMGGLIASNVEMILLLYQPTTYEVSDVIGTYLLRMSNMAQGAGHTVGGRLPDFSLSTAVGLFNGIIACFLVVSANRISKMVGDVSVF
jgi:putative aldouronate transport system permease protein